MSRIGKKPIPIPEGVKVTLRDHCLSITGPKGSLERIIPPPVSARVDEGNKRIILECVYQTKQDKALHGLMRSLVNNMIIGVTAGYEKRLEIIGVGYNAKVQGQELILQIGLTHPVKIPIPNGIMANTPNPNLIILGGIDKQLLGQFAAEVRAIKPAEPYNLKGIKYTDEIVRRKAGKTFVSGK